MAKVTITISDSDDDDTNTAVGDFRVDYEGAPEGTPPTMAVLFGATIQRMWRSRALAPMVPLVCDDLMRLRARAASGAE